MYLYVKIYIYYSVFIEKKPKTSSVHQLQTILYFPALGSNVNLTDFFFLQMVKTLLYSTPLNRKESN